MEFTFNTDVPATPFDQGSFFEMLVCSFPCGSTALSKSYEKVNADLQDLVPPFWERFTVLSMWAPAALVFGPDRQDGHLTLLAGPPGTLSLALCFEAGLDYCGKC